jgi:hypothetical protein
MRCVFSYVVFILFAGRTMAQSIHIDTLKGDVVTGKKVVINQNYYETPKIVPLNVSKYVDTSQAIHIIYGTNSVGVKLEQLKAGLAPIGIGDPITNAKILYIKLVKGKLQVSSDVFDFDGKITADIEKNELQGSRAFSQYTSDSLLEIIDDYHVPVLQIKLNRKCNCIYVGGVFNYLQGYVIISQTNGMTIHFEKTPKLLMTEAHKDSARFIYLNLASAIKPIHDQ